MKKMILAAGFIAFSDAALAHTGLLPTGGFADGFLHPFLGLDHCLVMLGLGLWASSQSRLLARQALGVFLLFMIVGALFGLFGLSFAYVETGISISLVLAGVALSFCTTPINVGRNKAIQAHSARPLVPTRCVGMQYRRAAPRVTTIPIVPTLRRGNSVRNALGNRSCVALPPASLQVAALRDAGASNAAFPRRSVGTIIILASIAAFASMHGLAHGSEMPITASAYAYIAGIVSATAVLHISGLVLGRIAQRVNATGLIHLYGTLAGLTGAWLLLA